MTVNWRSWPSVQSANSPGPADERTTALSAAAAQEPFRNRPIVNF
jgi:hypothetical protein